MLVFFERLINPYPEEAFRNPPQKLLAFIWFCTRGLRRYILAMTLLTATIGAFEAMLFAMLGWVIDWIGQVPLDQFWDVKKGSLIALLLVLFASIGCGALQNGFKYQTLMGNFPMRLRWNFHRLMLGQSMGFYQDEFAGRVAAKVMQTALAVRDTVMVIMDILVFVVIYFVTSMVVLGSFDFWILLPFALWLGTYLIGISYFVPRLARVATKQADARSSMNGRITDAYTNIATLKLFSHAQREADYARTAMDEFVNTVHQQMRLVTGFEVVNHTLSMLLIIGTMGTTIWLWTKGLISAGGLAAAAAMAIRLNGISHWIMWEMSSLFEHIGTVQDGINTLAQPHTVLDEPNAKPLVVEHGEIRFEDVSFHYGKANSVISGFNLTIQPGEKIGLVGHSGAGKSTIVNLLLRFYDLEQGHILIDKQEISGVTQESLRAQIGMVTQDTSLLHRSVRDNILYGRPHATEAQMIAAAQHAEAHEFILTLADSKGRLGYDAHVGERGVKLSGGQRQRIAIARVMLKDAPILLLDEATSALDSEVEAAIQSTLYNLMQGKTVVAIAHRLSTIAAMDRLIVLDKGEIVEEGDHNTLLAMNGLYARLWAHQSGGFLGATPN